jgi:hypothetical protein
MPGVLNQLITSQFCKDLVTFGDILNGFHGFFQLFVILITELFPDKLILNACLWLKPGT